MLAGWASYIADINDPLPLFSFSVSLHLWQSFYHSPSLRSRASVLLLSKFSSQVVRNKLVGFPSRWWLHSITQHYNSACWEYTALRWGDRLVSFSTVSAVDLEFDKLSLAWSLELSDSVDRKSFYFKEVVAVLYLYSYVHIFTGYIFDWCQTIWIQTTRRRWFQKGSSTMLYFHVKVCCFINRWYQEAKSTLTPIYMKISKIIASTFSFQIL